MKILGIYTEWANSEYRKQHNAYGGLGYYRIVKPLQALSKFGHEITVTGDLSMFGKNSEEIWTNVFVNEGVDLVYMKQSDSPVAVSNLLAAAKHFGKKVFVDVDDNHLAVKPGTPAYDAYKVGNPRRYYMSAQMSLCDRLVVSTEPLKETYKDLKAESFVLPNCNDYKDWCFPKKKHNDGKIRIGYMGSVTHNQDFELIIEPLRRVLQKYPHVEFETLGLMGKDTMDKFKKRFRAVKGKLSIKLGTPSWDGYPELLGQMGWDIGIAPLVDDEFNRCKSHIKWMEYAMYQIPCIASRVYPYYAEIDGVKTIVHGETGMLANTDDEWFDGLCSLIENADLRNSLGNNAYDYIIENWQWGKWVNKWNDLINS